MRICGSTSTSRWTNMTSFWKRNTAGVESAAANPNQVKALRLTTTTELVTLEGSYAFSVTRECSGRDLPTSLSEPQLTSLTRQLEKHLEEMSSLLIGLESESERVENEEH